MMLDAVTDFVDDLRSAGVPVSTGEFLDGIAALDATGTDERNLVKCALRAAFVKRPEHLQPFDLIFDSRFALRSAEDEAVWDEEDLRELLAGLGADADDDAVNAAVRQAVLQYAGLVPGRFLGVEYHVRRVMRHLQNQAAISVASEIDVDGEVSPAWWKSNRVRDMVEGEVRRHGVREKGREWVVEEAAGRSPEAFDFLRATPAEVRELDRVVTALGRRLAARVKRRQRRGNRGRLHVGSTVRRSLATGGVPFDPVFRKPHRHKPDVVVLADVSGSVATFARFTLQLVHSLSSEFSKLRTFAFVDEVDEVTRWLHGGTDFQAAMAEVDAKGRTLGDAGHSDYGKVFEDFEHRHGREINSGTTVLILGDARNNYHPVRAQALASVAKRARKVYWLNPEPRPYWNTADSVIGAYGQHCDAVLECRNVAQLQRAVEQLA